MAHDFYVIDSKVEEVGRALGLDEIGMDRDVTELSGGQRTKVLLGKLLLQKPDIMGDQDKSIFIFLKIAL